MKQKTTVAKTKNATEPTMNIKDIESLIKFVQNSGVAEVSLEQKDIKITIRTTHGQMMMASAPSTSAPVQHYVAAPAVAQSAANSTPPAADKPKSGADIKQGKVLCIIEAMKLFNEIESEVSGKIVKVLVDNATPVEYDQPLFLVDPS